MSLPRFGPEDQLQIEIMDWLDTHLARGRAYHTPNEGRRSFMTGLKLKRMGLMPGVPDITIMLPDARVAYVEVKAPKSSGRSAGVLSPAQRVFQSLAEDLGHTVIVARSLDDVRAGLRAIGVPYREVQAA